MDEGPVFTQDWFSEHIPLWAELLAEYVGLPDLRFLEIGSYEGRSAVWLMENVLTHPGSSLTCIDTWEPNRFAPGEPDFFLRFMGNTKKYRDEKKLLAMIGPSYWHLVWLITEDEPFDFIYIDGSHHAVDVLSDAVMGWHLLKDGGLLAFDDYQNIDPIPGPGEAIDAFLSVYACTLVHMDKQVWVRK